MSGIIYHLFCTVTGKAYVGQTWETLEKRWSHHKKYSSRCIKLQRALQKYGPDAFVRSVLTQGLTTQEQMDAAEQYWISYFDCIKNGYNLRDGGSRGHHSEESKAKTRATMTGHVVLAETRAKISASRRGQVASVESKIQRSRSQGGRPFVDQNGHRYETTRDAARKLGLRSGNISLVLHGDRLTTGGYSFKYLEQSRV